jgi:hypothetical protein
LYWRGKLDEIKLYDVAMTENQVFAQYVQPGFIPEVGLSLWVRADSGIHQNNFQVTQWEDISGHGNHFFQADLSKQPLQVLQEINSKPVVRFDG